VTRRDGPGPEDEWTEPSPPFIVGNGNGSRPGNRASRLGAALAAMSAELGAARREIVQLKRENATLRGQVHRSRVR
jgi:hypothetical protein